MMSLICLLLPIVQLPFRGENMICVRAYLNVGLCVIKSFFHLQAVRLEPHFHLPVDPHWESYQQLVSAVHLTDAQNPLGTPEHIATFVVNTLFSAITGSIYGLDVSKATVAEKITIWFKAYR